MPLKSLSRCPLNDDLIRIQSLGAAGVARHGDALDRIFFAASSVRNFPDAHARARFRARWLGRYLDSEVDHAFVALAPDGAVIGYVVGMLVDAALDGRFADIASVRIFAAISSRYPAHLHINVDVAWRGRGVGAKLIAAFTNHARAAGVDGLHIVTGAGMRNVGFYMTNGFREVARADVDGKPLVMLGLDLHGDATA